MASTTITSRPPRLLLTSVCRPFGGPGEGDSVGSELFHKQVTRAQGPFSLRQTIRVWGLDFIAENIRAPTVVLHYPSFDQLVRELGSSDYTHVGINFVVATFHKVRQMVPLIRRAAPHAQIVLGGYGTVLPDDLLRPYADAICREEGIGFMRRLLGEPDDAPIRQPHAPIPSAQVLSHQRNSFVGHVTAGLGCSNACDFCCTSHFFKRKYVPFLRTGREIYEALLSTQARARAEGATMNSFILIDEDFFIHRRRARQFLDCVREGGTPLSLMGFGSVRGLSQFSAREVAEMGFDVVWNAFEGEKAGYTKQQGVPMRELYRDFRSVGISALTSMIIGFPYQDEAVMRAEFEQLMALQPAMIQCLIYFAFPGTPFHEQVISERRYLPRYRERPDLRRWDGFSMHFEHPLFDDPKRIEALQREFYRRDFERLGPTLMRLGAVWLSGYLELKDDPNPLLAARARRLRSDARTILPALSAAVALGPSVEVRERAERLRAQLIRHTGGLTPRERAMEWAAPAMHLATRALVRAGIAQQPGLLRVEHRTPLAKQSARTQHAMQLQGTRFAVPPSIADAIMPSIADAITPSIADAIGRMSRRFTWQLPPLAEIALDVVTLRATGMQPSFVPK